ncbi:epithelial-stromal interaction protein 1 [Dunckerocampus dactyliophorus]|uniref:epithelial-stromal interaction protein 1 n=1 Tax=Dunckerocampus dactyliophorus TaxID=161453 RepID=UPI002405BA31|nr:epithelial-stromal interaction protein 1 [Dunckerocampus dactyliophorus]
MPSTKISKHKPAEESPSKPRNKFKELQVPPLHKSRAASCPRASQKGGLAEVTCKRRTRSRSTAPRPNGLKGKQDLSLVNHALLDAQWRDGSKGPGQRGRGGVQTQMKPGIQSHRAYTVIPPNPQKRQEIQRKAEAELAALEELRLSRTMANVTIKPSSVGGCMSLEEVRLKQQQEMMQAKRKPIRKQRVQQTHILTG